MLKNPFSTLSRRERQIMDILYRLGRATANEVITELHDDKHSSTVRTQLRVLATLDDKNLIEIFGLQLACDKR